MSIKIKRVIFTTAIVVGVIWNVLCLLKLLPLEKWSFSLAIVGIGSLFTLIPLLFSVAFQKDEKSKYMADLEKRERIYAGITIGSTVVWTVTIVACLVYPL